MTDRDDTPLTLKVKRLTETAKLPTKAKDGDAAFDLYSDEPSVECHFGHPIRTGIAAEIPDGYFGLVLGRSSVAKRGADVIAGVIDSGYRGEWHVQIHGFTKVEFERGDKIGQVVILPVPQVEVVEVDELSPSARGSGGFGSSGR